MANSFVTYPDQTGTQTDYAVPFGFLEREHVNAYVEATPVTFTWLNDGLVRMDAAPEGDLTIRRVTPVDARAVTFFDGSTHSAEKHNRQNDQIIFIAQETQEQAGAVMGNDGVEWDARALPIGNIPDPTEDNHAATKGWVNNSTESNVNEIIAIRNELYGLSTEMVRLPYGSEGYVEYDPALGRMTVYLSEGPQGVAGPQGPSGATGPQGPTGAEGPRGPQGPVGATGATGPQGPTGAEGPRGIQGVKGDQGIQGVTGPTGPEGPTGPIGPQGSKGETGATGLQGPTGATGPQGPEGPQGIQGPEGPQGIQGPEGPQGIQGEKGGTGDKGPTGDQGPTGDTPLGLAFGQFNINEDGELLMEYVGYVDPSTFSMDANGDIYVETSSVNTPTPMAAYQYMTIFAEEGSEMTTGAKFSFGNGANDNYLGWVAPFDCEITNFSGSCEVDGLNSAYGFMVNGVTVATDELTLTAGSNRNTLQLSSPLTLMGGDVVTFRCNYAGDASLTGGVVLSAIVRFLT